MPETHDVDRRIGTLSDICTPGFVRLDTPDGPSLSKVCRFEPI
jgi:hypothetical protein